MSNAAISTPNKKKWFELCFKTGAFAVGGGGRILIYQEFLVDDHGWMLLEEFREAVTVTQVAPGPPFVNLATYLGFKLTNVWATIVGLCLLGIPGPLVGLFIMHFVNLNSRGMTWLFQGFSLGSILIFAIFAWNMATGLTSTENKKISVAKKKLIFRASVAALVGGASLLGLPFMMALIGGSIAGLCVEFLS